MYELSARAHERGRGLKDVEPEPGRLHPFRAGHGHYVIFIHGYNNNAIRARKIWNATLDWLSDHRVPLDHVVLFYWPGDEYPDRARSAIMYPRQVPVALDTAGKLADYIAAEVGRAPKKPRISFVAHSLGCLVTLETIRQLRLRAVQVDVRVTLLMAAAVPAGNCARGHRYGQPFSRTTRDMVLYSLADGVLKYFFRAGQRLADALPRARRRAVGRSGGPSIGGGGRWRFGEDMDDCDHGDYWGRAGALTHIAGILGARPDFTKGPKTPWRSSRRLRSPRRRPRRSASARRQTGRRRAG